MRMRQIMMLPVLFLAFSLSGFAQQGTKSATPPTTQEAKTGRQGIITMKKEFFKKNFILTDKEAESFWPLFANYLDEENKIHKNFRMILSKEGIQREQGEVKRENMDPKSIILYYDQKLKMKQELLKAETEFHGHLKEILHPENIALYYKLEKEFKKELAALREKRKTKSPMPVLKQQPVPMEKSSMEIPEKAQKGGK